MPTFACPVSQKERSNRFVTEFRRVDGCIYNGNRCAINDKIPTALHPCDVRTKRLGHNNRLFDEGKRGNFCYRRCVEKVKYFSLKDRKMLFCTSVNLICSMVDLSVNQVQQGLHIVALSLIHI